MLVLMRGGDEQEVEIDAVGDVQLVGVEDHPDYYHVPEGEFSNSIFDVKIIARL